MPRLFVALDLTDVVKQELVRIQPSGTPGLRIAKPTHMHVTLHFIGEADLQFTVDALKNVSSPTFSLQIEGVGRFPPAGRATVLWAGVQVTGELTELHAAIGSALSKTGFQPESRRYAPHITLARCGHKVSDRIVEQFLSQHADLKLAPIPITGFALYSSTNVNDEPVYQCEEWFPFERL